jgi:hypothetical protein
MSRRRYGESAVGSWPRQTELPWTISTASLGGSVRDEGSMLEVCEVRSEIRNEHPPGAPSAIATSQSPHPAPPEVLHLP